MKTTRKLLEKEMGAVCGGSWWDYFRKLFPIPPIPKPIPLPPNGQDPMPPLPIPPAPLPLSP